MTGMQHRRLHIVGEDDPPEDPDDAEGADGSEGDEEAIGLGDSHGHEQTKMEDKDVQRLEDRIEASEERGRLRLELAMTRVDGKLDGLTAAIQEVSRLSSTQATEAAARHRELRNTVIATGVVVLFGMLATLIGLKQVWIGGVQVGLPLGQAMQIQQTPAPSSVAPAPEPQRTMPSPSPTVTPAKPNG
jgi:hypothetical protein